MFETAPARYRIDARPNGNLYIAKYNYYERSFWSVYARVYDLDRLMLFDGFRITMNPSKSIFGPHSVLRKIVYDVV